MCMSFKSHEMYFTISGRFGINQMFRNKVLYFIVKCFKSLISRIPLIPHPSSLIHILFLQK